MVRLIKEFKEFAARGNVVDLAVGVVIGAAFGKVVSSMVQDIISPPLGLLMGGVDLSRFSLVLKAAAGDAAAVTLNYGSFLQTLLDFLIVSAAIFMVVKAMNALRREKEAAPAAPPPPTKEEQLLTEIRDLLKSK